MFVFDDFASRHSFRRGPALVGFLSVMLWVFQVMMVQPLCLCWSNETQSGESENRSETEDIDCPAQLTSGLRSRARQAVRVAVPSTSCRASHRVALTATSARLCVPLGNPAWCCPLRC